MSHTTDEQEHPEEEQLTAFAAGELGEEERSRTDRHLLSCSACARLAAEYSGLLAALREMPVITPARTFAVDEVGERRARRSFWPAYGALAASLLLALGMLASLAGPPSGGTTAATTGARGSTYSEAAAPAPAAGQPATAAVPQKAAPAAAGANQDGATAGAGMAPQEAAPAVRAAGAPTTAGAVDAASVAATPPTAPPTALAAGGEPAAPGEVPSAQIDRADAALPLGLLSGAFLLLSLGLFYRARRR